MKLDDNTSDIMETIPNDILTQSKFTIDEIKGYFAELESIFKDLNYPEIFLPIYNTAALDSLVELSKNLKILRLNNCQGFTRHIETYNNKNELRHNYFVASLAGFLISKVDSLELEPAVNHYNKITDKIEPKKNDILIKLEEIEIYIEHKSINTEEFIFFDEHLRIFQLLIKYLIDLPYQIEIIYKDSKFSDADIEKLGEILKEKVPLMPSEKIINVTDAFEVCVLTKIDRNKQVDHIHGTPLKGHSKTFKDIFHSVVYEGEVIRLYMQENECKFGRITIEDEKYSYPMHIFHSGGKSQILIVGPKIEFSKIIERTLERAKSQSPYRKPYVLAINDEEILGSKEKNMWTQAIAKYTRFSGVIFVKMDGSKELDFEFKPNPRGEFIQAYVTPISKYFRLIKNKR